MTIQREDHPRMLITNTRMEAFSELGVFDLSMLKEGWATLNISNDDVLFAYSCFFIRVIRGWFGS